MRTLILCALALLPAGARAAVADWRTLATADDRARLRSWRSDWTAALAQARAAGKGGEIAAEGLLLQPDAGRGGPPPPPGEYRCRTTKLGAKPGGLTEFAAYPPFACRIALEGDLMSFARLNGPQRPVGFLFPNRDGRLVFLGTMMLGDEGRAQQYGRDAQRDMIGALERIGPQRWRLVLPQPRWESMLDVIELVPAS
ncbi:DUF4893 domain-containing protein [Sphingomonas jatrophae]|uniref:DUF4893 domain-containing protein n=1 Tax=Sphingomonas jatrophae TaxID=1166337 RepID=A0A1I6K396_9SPHN|nr:DUF4893 domain-containing protein [Sphingomonas jatrophae]SFR85699.1 protein of unknown function [Sphingomonas jatrophae]